MQTDNYAIANQKNCSLQKYTNMRRTVILYRQRSKITKDA